MLSPWRTNLYKSFQCSRWRLLSIVLFTYSSCFGRILFHLEAFIYSIGIYFRSFIHLNSENKSRELCSFYLLKFQNFSIGHTNIWHESFFFYWKSFQLFKWIWRVSYKFDFLSNIIYLKILSEFIFSRYKRSTIFNKVNI